MYNVDKLLPVYSTDLLRLGRKRDGGYVLNRRTINKADVLLTFGISTDWSFESDVYRYKKNVGIQILAFDYSVDFFGYWKMSRHYVLKAISGKRPVFHFLFAMHLILVSFKYLLFFSKKGIGFHKLGLGIKDEGLFLSFPTIFGMIHHNLRQNGVIVKMDIEGGEYDVLEALLPYSEFISTIALEFHELNNKGDKFENLVERLRENGYCIAHVHPNNGGGFIQATSIPALLEITFTKQDLFTDNELATLNNQTYPLPGLDYPCVQWAEEIPMPFQIER